MFYSRREIADKTGFSLRQVNRMIQQGLLEPVCFSSRGKILVTAASWTKLQKESRIRGREMADQMFTAKRGGV
jgi:hypothetical protein